MRERLAANRHGEGVLGQERPHAEAAGEGSLCPGPVAGVRARWGLLPLRP